MFSSVAKVHRIRTRVFNFIWFISKKEKNEEILVVKIGSDEQKGNQVEGITIYFEKNKEYSQNGTKDSSDFVKGIDHIVFLTFDLKKLEESFQKFQLFPLRKLEMKDRTYCFFKVGDILLEFIEPTKDCQQLGVTRFWGIAFRADVERVAQKLGEMVSPLKEAKQKGRRICTLKRDAGFPFPVAFISQPHKL